MVRIMNKTVLLACCDFLILATLALSSFKKAPLPEAESSFEADNSFQVSENEEVDDKRITEMYYQQKLNELEKESEELRAELLETNKELLSEKETSARKDSKIHSLTKQLAATKNTVFKKVLNNLWQVNVSMKEDDSFRPDSFQTSFFSCSFKLEDSTYLLADFQNLGFQWTELLNDGNISRLSITLAKTGPNPWSSLCKNPILSLSQVPGLCLIKVPKSRVYSPMDTVNEKNMPNYLDKVYASKADGRIIKVANVSVLPNSPSWIVIDEERFLGHPDKVEKGDVLVTGNGLIIGLVSKEKRSGNKSRLYSHLISSLDLSEHREIPLKKNNSDVYFKDFVEAARSISRTIIADK